MKFHGEAIQAPDPSIVVIPRQPKDLVFVAEAVLDFEEFENLCPTPLPPTITKPGGEQYQDVNDPEHKLAFDKWAGQKSDWMFLKAFENTEGLEWETVDMSDADTWGNYKDELKASKFSDMEVSKLMLAVMDACGLDEDKMEAARKRFLAGQEAAQKE